MVLLFNIPTLMICLLVGWTLNSVLMSISWFFDRKSNQLGMWSIGFWCVSIGTCLQALRGIVPESLGIGVGGALVLLGSGLVWVGFRIFDGFSRSRWFVVAITAIWLLCYFGVNIFSANPDYRIVLYTILTVAQLSALVTSIWSGWKRDHFPVRLVIIFMLLSYGFVMLMRIPLVMIWPVTEIGGVAQTPWVPVVTFILYVNSLGLGIGIFALSSHRSLMQYKHASEIDMLTGVLNRRAFYERAQSQMHKNAGVLALIDLDHFKYINDAHGHAGGDAALCAFGKTMIEQLDANMVFGRLGGEEFALFMPQMTGGEALAFCDGLRQSVARLTTPWRDATITMTISIGMHEVVKAGADLDAVSLRADAALYQAKNQGRDRCILSAAEEAVAQKPEEGMAAVIALTGAKPAAVPELS
ncbi:GGDEF domain-containing protein [Agrobacterium vitis]|uniref:GGDEF domain-containing protein n=2 Tax=Agrobacterium vitis TaxID=373 RepID=UPI003D2D621C